MVFSLNLFLQKKKKNKYHGILLEMEVIVGDEALFLWMNLGDGGVHWCFSILQVLEGKWVWYEVCNGSNCWSMVEDGNGRVCGVRFGFMNKWSYWWPIATQIYLGNFFVQFDVASFT